MKEPKFKVGDKVQVMGKLNTTITEVQLNGAGDMYLYYFLDNEGVRWFTWEGDIKLIEK